MSSANCEWMIRCRWACMCLIRAQAPAPDGSHEGHISYVPGINGEPGELKVFIDNTLVLTTAIDLGNYGAFGSTAFDGNGEAYVGFTAGTGLADSKHEIENWAFFGDTGGGVLFAGWVHRLLGRVRRRMLGIRGCHCDRLAP